MTEQEIKDIRDIIQHEKPELIIQNHTNIMREYCNDMGIEITDDLERVTEAKKKVFCSHINHFHVTYLRALNNGDIICIDQYKLSGNTALEDCSPCRHGNFISNNYETLWHIKGRVADLAGIEASRAPELPQIDVLVTASSRPQLLPHCVESFKKYMHTRRKMRWILHEDFVYPKESEKVIEWANKTGHFDVVRSTNPAKGLGVALGWLIKKTIDTKYCLYLQDDWELERPIDLDHVLYAMDNNPKINFVIFNKYKNLGAINGFSQLEYNFSGIPMCIYNSVSFIPSIWRMSIVKSKWTDCTIRPEGTFANQFGSHQMRMDKRYCEENLGAYLYGCSGDPRYVKHNGNNWRMASWRLVNGMPGGNPDIAVSGENYRAPWIPYQERPLYDGRVLK